MAFETSRLPWFALYVKARHEKHVASVLGGKGFESFLPIYRKLSKYSKRYDLPLFPGYVFCRLNAADSLPVRVIPGVFSIVGNGITPCPVPDEEIESIRRMLESGLTPCPWPYISAGRPVRLETGPLQGVQGVIMDADHKKWLVISVDLLQRSVAVKVDRDLLTSITPICPPHSLISIPKTALL